MAAADTARLIAELTLNDKFSPGATKVIRSLGLMEDGFKKVRGQAAKGLSTAAGNIAKIGAVAAGAAAGLGVASVKLAADFEAQLNTINSVAQVGSAELTKIGEGIRALSRETGTSTDDLTAAYYDLVSAGIAASDAQNVLAQANTLAIGGLSTTAEAVDLLTTAINAYGGDVSVAERVTNAFAESIGAGKVTAAELAASFAQVGPMAANFGISVDEIAASIALMTAQGTGAAEAFTQIRSAMVALEKPTADLQKIQKKLGVNFAEMARDKGLAFAYNEIAKAAEDAGIPMVKLTGRIEGSLFAAQVAGDNFAAYSAELEKVEKSSEGVGVAQQQAEQRMKGFSFQAGLLKANLRDIGITIGTEVLPEFAALAKEGTEWIQTHQPEIKQFAKDIAAGVREAVKVIKSLDFEAIGASLKLAGQGAKAILDLFLSMPPWVQTAVITGWGLNKLTGGALGSIVGELGKGLIKGVLGMNAGVVNIKAGVVNGAGGLGGAAGAGAAGAATGAKGTLAKAASVLSKVFIVGAAAGVFAELTGVLVDQRREAEAQTAALNEQTRVFKDAANQDALRQSVIGVQSEITRLNNEISLEGLAFRGNMNNVRTTVEQTARDLQLQLQLNSIADVRAQENSDARNAAEQRANRIAIDKGRHQEAQTTSAVRLAADRDANEQAKTKAAIQAASAIEARYGERTVGSLVQAKAAIDRVRSGVGAASGLLSKIHAKPTSFTVNNTLRSAFYVDGRRFSQELDRSTTVVRAGQPGQNLI